MRLRVVRFPVGGGRFENLATSLARAAHGPGELGEIYALRWGIETAFRGLKHAVGLARLHSAGFRGAAQEVYARMVLYNLCSAMAALAQLVVDARPRGGLKHARAVNFAAAVRVFVNRKTDISLCRFSTLRQQVPTRFLDFRFP